MRQSVHRWLDRSVVLSFDRTGFARHQRHFVDDAERDLDGRDVLVTGGTAGIGLAAAEALAARGAQLHLWARSAERGAPVAERLGGTFTAVDLGDLSDVGTAARQAEVPDLAAVVLNAGAMPLERTLTPQGHELIWASQVLGHLLLLRVLRERGLLHGDTRVIWVASGGLYLQQLDLRDLSAEHAYQRHTVYANAKRAQLEIAAHLAERWPDVPMAVMHPGWVDTAAVRSGMPVFGAVMRPLLRAAPSGADTIVWLATREPAWPSGRFWFDRTEVPEHTRRSTHTRPGDAERLVERVFADTEGFVGGG